MTRLSPVLAFLLIYFLHADFGECVTVILGDSYMLGNCPTGVPAELYLVADGIQSGQHSTELVAAREEDVWKPAEDYEDRMKISAGIGFSRTEYSDTGLYELRCAGQPLNSTQLDVVLASEVSATEGGNATLPCYITGGHVDSIKWSRGGEMVLEQSLSSGEIKHGPGVKKRLSLSPDGYKKGNWSLIFNPVLLEDGGDYFCSFHLNGAREGRGDPAAVRMRVSERSRDQTTGHPSLTPSQGVPQDNWAIVGKIAVGVFVALILLIPLGWWLKCRCSRPGPGGGRYSDVSTGPPTQANGCSPSDNAQAESPV